MGLDKRGRAEKKAKKDMEKRLMKQRSRREFEEQIRQGNFEDMTIHVDRRIEKLEKKIK